MIKLLCNAFPQTDFWKHVGLVFTRFYDYMPERQKKSKEKFAVKFNEEIETLTKESGNQYLFGNKLICPTFFVDSLNEESEKDNNTKEEINRLLVWASTLEPLDVKEIKEVDLNIKEEIIEECTKKIDENNP